jgi:hypothetical protein
VPAAVPVSPAERWKDFFLLAGRRDLENLPPADAAADAARPKQPDWRFRVVVRQTTRRDDLMKIEPSSDAPFRALSSNAILAMVQNAPLPDVLGSYAPMTNILSLLPLPDAANQRMSARQAIRVRAVPPDDRISCSVARQTPDTCELARTMDPLVSRGVQSIEERFEVKAPPPQDYAGLAPNAVRTTPLACSTQGALGIFTSRQLVVSWAYPSQPAANGPANLADPAMQPGACAVPNAGAQRPGWWVLNICQTDAPVQQAKPAAELAPGCVVPVALVAPAVCKATPGEILRADANALLMDTPAPAGNQADPPRIARWVWLAFARPAALESRLPALLPDFNGVRSALRRIDHVNLELQITEQGDIQGDLALRLSPPAPK